MLSDYYFLLAYFCLQCFVAVVRWQERHLACITSKGCLKSPSDIVTIFVVTVSGQGTAFSEYGWLRLRIKGATN